MEEDIRKTVENVRTCRQNVLPAHSDHVWYRSEEELQAQKSSYRMCLNGIWKCCYAEIFDGTPDGFEQCDFDVSDWDEIQVPGHIQLQGYDKPSYNNVQYPWDGREPLHILETPEKYNPVMSYVTFFTVPQAMQSEEIRISFEGVESGMALWCNGSYVGYSEDSFTPHDFLLSPYLHGGINRLAVQVIKWTPSSWLEDQDMFRFSGIFRDVWLYSVPHDHIEDLKVEGSWNEQKNIGTLHTELQISQPSGCTSWKLLYQGREIASGTVENKEHVSFDCIVDQPKLWSAEAPHLYQLLLYTGTEWIMQETGFRNIEIKDRQILLNGKRVVFKGVNRHEFDCDHGRVPDPKQIRQDVFLMKQNNINALRTSHYANAHWIYEDCDRYGIMMIAENNLESHGIFDMVLQGKIPQSEALPGDREEVLDLLLDRVNSTYQCNKNHVSILIWSVGNESYGGKDIYEMSQLFRKLDPHRPVHYEGIMHDRRYNDTSDMESQMYTPAAQCEQFLQKHPEKPMILCECSHSMGNSTGGLHKYIELAYRNPLFQGCFIWDLADQTIRRKNRFGQEYQAYGGDFLERPNDADFSADGLLTGEHKPYAKMQEVKAVYQDITAVINKDTIQITNHALFTNTDAYDAEIVLKQEGMVLQRMPLHVCVKPGETAEISNPITIPDAPGEYTETISWQLKHDTPWNPEGTEVCWAQGVFTNKMKQEVHAGSLTVIHGDYNIGVIGDGFDFLFEKNKGGLTSCRTGNREWLEAVPRLNFWRAPTQNDNGYGMQQRMGMWKLASQYQTAFPVEMSEAEKQVFAGYPIVKEQDNCVSITWKYWLPGTGGQTADLTYQIYGDGTVHMEAVMDPKKGLADMPEFGILMKWDAAFSHLKWYGRGPAETYCDRNHAKIDVYANAVKDNVQPYIVPQETGNHNGTRWAEISDEEGNRVRLMSMQKDGMDFSAIPYTPAQLEEAKHPYELPASSYTVVRCSLKQMGVGGDNSWGAQPLEEYHLKPDHRLVFDMAWKVIPASRK